jgi:hypothetical protein
MSSEEPTQVLSDGTTVLCCILEYVIELQQAGHTITLDDDGHVVVTPAVNDDLAYMLDSNRRDIAAILETSAATYTVH